MRSSGCFSRSWRLWQCSGRVPGTLWTLILIEKTRCFCVLQLRSCVVVILQPFLLAPGDSSAILWLFLPIPEPLATLRTRARDTLDLDSDGENTVFLCPATIKEYAREIVVTIKEYAGEILAAIL